MVLAQKKTHRSMEQNREPRNGPSTLWSTNLRQSRKECPMEKRTVSSTNGVGKTVQPHAELTGSLSYTIQKNKLKMDERPKCDRKPLKS